MNAKFIPDNLPDCFAMIERRASAKALDRLRFRPRDELVKEHLFGWGPFLRNRFIHSRRSPVRDKIEVLPTLLSHPDSCGSFLLEALWMHLNGQNGPEAVLEILLTTWHGVAEVAPEMFESGVLEEFLNTWQNGKPTLEDVLPLFERNK